jgi:alkyl sulfatase BDS1-like metallo-beta-lactamase superfamily hydrolase
MRKEKKMNVLSKTFFVALISLVFSFNSNAGAKEQHYHPKGKMPSKFTVELQNGLRKSLPFEDKRDFEENKRGFIAAPDYTQIKADAGHVAWDMGRYEWLLEGKVFDSIHPSLQRQAILNIAGSTLPTSAS